MKLQPCPDKSTLDAFAAGQLPGDSGAEVSRHVDGCDVCRAAVGEYNPSFLATLAPEKNRATEGIVAISPQLLRFSPDHNRDQLPRELRPVADGFAAALQGGAEADIARFLADNGIKSDSLDLPVEHVMLLLELLHMELRRAWTD